MPTTLKKCKNKFKTIKKLYMNNHFVRFFVTRADPGQEKNAKLSFFCDPGRPRSGKKLQNEFETWPGSAWVRPESDSGQFNVASIKAWIHSVFLLFQGFYGTLHISGGPQTRREKWDLVENRSGIDPCLRKSLIC